MNRYDSSISVSGTQSDDGYESNYIEIKKEKKRVMTLDYKLYDKLITFFNVNNNILMNIKNKKDIIKYSQKTQTDEEIIIDESKKEMKQKEKEILILRQENIELKNELEKNKNLFLDLEKKYNNIKDEYNKEIKEKNDIIEKLNEKINQLNIEINNNKNKMFNMIHYSSSERVFDNEKLVDKILTYLPFEYYLTLASLNKKIHFHLYYKKKYLYIENKYKAKLKLIKEITDSNIPIKYQIDDEEILKLVKKYPEPHLIPGNPMRYSLLHYLLFIENIVRKPLQEQYDKKEKKEISEKAKLILNDIYKVITNEEINEITQIMKHQKIKKELNSKILSIFKDDFIDLNKMDKNIINMFKNDDKINIKFEFKSADDIKTLLRYFLKNGLAQEYYNKFFQYLIDEYSELFYNCYESLNSIKELEIVNIAIDSRYKRTNYLMKEMNYMVTELNNYCETSKNLKETLLKQKNEVEIKYNNCLMLNSSLNKKIVNDSQLIEKLKEEKSKIKDEVNVIKNKMIKDYQKIEKSYNNVNKERNELIKVFLDLKNFFIKTISYTYKIE